MGWSTECWLWCRWLWEECVDPRDASVLICGEKTVLVTQIRESEVKPVTERRTFEFSSIWVPLFQASEKMELTTL